VKVEPLFPSTPSDARSFGGVVSDFVSLTKPRLSGLVLFTAAGGMWLAKQPLDWKTWLFAMLGTAGTVGSANAINCVIERDSDKFMARTARRPLPTDRLGPKSALWFAGILGALSLPLLAFGVNWLTGLLGALALGSYAFVYTPLKARTHWSMQVGAFPGALPPLMGWTAATGRIELPGVVLFAILFFWQLTHSIAIGLFRKGEYEAAQLKNVAIEKGDDVARAHAVLYLLFLIPVSFGPSLVGVAGWPYAVAAAGLGAWFLGVAVRGWRQKLGAVWARQLFVVSLVYLTGLFAALALAA
jgi:protoheme IX farnesyltransferase